MDTKISSYKKYILRIQKEKIPCYEPSVGKLEIQYLTKVINSGWLSEKDFTRKFENFIANFSGRRFALSFTNATSALIVGMKALGIKSGDDVIVPSFTHSADPNSISATGARPVFAEVSSDSLCLSLNTIQKAKTKKTKAILYVAAYGNCDELDKIEKYAKKSKIFLIIDAAAALGSIYKKRHISSYGIFSVHSFFADKTITTGEGGMLLTDNNKLLATCNLYKHDGRKERGVDKIEKAGLNCRFTELQAAVGLAQVKKINFFIKKKKEIYKFYAQEINKINNVEIFKYNKFCNAVPHRIIIFVKNNSKKLIRFLTNSGIGVRTLFLPMHNQPAYNQKKKFLVSNKLFLKGVCLPSSPKLTKKQILFICNKIKYFYGK